MANRDLTCDRLRKVETSPKETGKMNVTSTVTDQQATGDCGRAVALRQPLMLPLCCMTLEKHLTSPNP